MTKKSYPDPRQLPNGKGITHSNDRAINTNETGQPGNLHQNLKHSPMQHDR